MLGNLPYNRLETRELFFRCGCSRSKVEKVLYSLGTAGIEEMRVNEGFAEVTCEFCRQSYRFEADELQRIELLSALPAEPEH